MGCALRKTRQQQEKERGKERGEGEDKAGCSGGAWGFTASKGKGKRALGRGERAEGTAKGKGTAQRVLGDDVEQKINQFLLWDLSDACE